jgi:heme O synthase-like polyprenyltransferase
MAENQPEPISQNQNNSPEQKKENPTGCGFIIFFIIFVLILKYWRLIIFVLHFLLIIAALLISVIFFGWCLASVRALFFSSESDPDKIKQNVKTAVITFFVSIISIFIFFFILPETIKIELIKFIFKYLRKI